MSKLSEGILKRYYRRYGIQCQGDSQKAKRELLMALLNSHEPHFAQSLAPVVALACGPELDKMLSHEINKDGPIGELPVSSHPLDIAQLFHEVDEIISKNKKYRWSAEKASKVLHAKSAKWSKRYKESKTLANVRRQAETQIKKLQRSRDELETARLLALLIRHSQDEVAMSLWASFCRWWQRFVCAWRIGDVAAYKIADLKIAEILNTDHPFATELDFALVRVSDVWKITGRFASELDQAPDEVLSRLGTPDTDPRELLDATGMLLRDLELFTPMQKPRAKSKA
jgi:hypothetical protein